MHPGVGWGGEGGFFLDSLQFSGGQLAQLYFKKRFIS